MEKYYISLLVNIEGLKYEDIKSALDRDINAEDIWKASEEDIVSMGFPLAQAKKFAKNRKNPAYDPDALFANCEKNSIRLIDYKNASYPKALLNITNFPLAIFVKGSLDEENDKIAMVGSRKASAYGISVAKQFAADLAKAGVAVVSGGAKGIDAASHQGALSTGGNTIAVFGCGLDVYYPRENKKLFDEILDKNGALISEYIPGAEPITWHFPARNRIISGLSRGVLVVEADKKSGSLITANFALESGRDIYCVPGSIYSSGSIGVHNLIKQGAMLVDRPEDILNDIGGLFAKKRSVNSSSFCYDIRKDDSLGKSAKTVYLSMVSGKTYNFDALLENARLLPHEVTMAVTELEMYGLLENNAGLYKCKERSGR